MKWLLDTCVLSELSKPRPEPKVVAWVDAQSDDDLFISTLTIGEIQKGVLLLSDVQKQIRVKKALAAIQERFEGRILPVDTAAALEWGRIQADAKRRGYVLPATDALLAATALANGLTLVTRNIADLRHIQVPVFDPWT